MLNKNSFRWLIRFNTTCTNRLTCSFLVSPKKSSPSIIPGLDKQDADALAELCLVRRFLYGRCTGSAVLHHLFGHPHISVGGDAF